MAVEKDHPAGLPAGDEEGLLHSADEDNGDAVRELSEAEEFLVLEVLVVVDLVTDDYLPVFLRDGEHLSDMRFAENTAARVRRVHDPDKLGFFVEELLEVREVYLPLLFWNETVRSRLNGESLCYLLVEGVGGFRDKNVITGIAE